jgi:hypothetical protein
MRRFRATIVSVEKQKVLNIRSVRLYAMRMRHIVTCGLHRSTLLYHIIL